MKKTDVYKYFGGVSATARALGMTRQGVQRWPNKVPRLTALAIECVSQGALKAEKPDPRTPAQKRMDARAAKILKQSREQ